MNMSFKKSKYIRAMAMDDIEQTLGELKSIILLEPNRPQHFNGEAEGVKDLFEELSIAVEVWVAAQEELELAVELNPNLLAIASANGR